MFLEIHEGICQISVDNMRYLNFPHNLVFVHLSKSFDRDFAENIAEVYIALSNHVSVNFWQKYVPEKWLTDTDSTLHTLVPSAPPPKPPNYPHSVEENIHISYVAYDPFSCCLFDLSSRLGGIVESTAWRRVTRWESVEEMIHDQRLIRQKWLWAYCVGIKKKDLHCWRNWYQFRDIRLYRLYNVHDVWK